MDELRFKQRKIVQRSMRRLAILAAINGSLLAPTVTWCQADEQTVEQTSQDDLRALLSSGWHSQVADSARSQSLFSGQEVQVAPDPSMGNPTVARENAHRLSPVQSGVRLTPINIESATELSEFVASKLTNRSSYADIPARAVSTKATIRKPASMVDDLPKLPSPTKHRPSVPAFTLPDLPTLPSVSIAQPSESLSSRASTSTDRGRRSSSDLSFDSVKLEALRAIAGRQGLGLLGQIEKSTISRSSIAKPVPISLDAMAEPKAPLAKTVAGRPTIRANKLGEIAAGQLADARVRLRRGATHSAKRLTIQALQNLAALQDVRQGGNQNARHLDAALTAVRESEDFNGKFGTVDQRSLDRLVIAHETSVLKDCDLSNVSPMRATEAYLTVAREEIVLATASVGLASDALVLLGRIERSMAHSSDQRSGAVALSLQQAAVEVDPANSHAWMELGTTMLNEGMVVEAVEVLNRSVELQPSRHGYGRLLSAARQAQDATTAERCLLALKNPALESQTPVRRIDQETFAAMYTPTNAIARNASPRNVDSSSSPQQAEVHPVSSKNKKFGLLRSWVIPKNRR